MIDRKVLQGFFSIKDQEHFRQEHKHWVEAELQQDAIKRKSLWSESFAVGSEGVVEEIQQQLGLRAKGRSVVLEVEGSALKESQAPYRSFFDAEKGSLRVGNSHFWDIKDGNTGW